MADNFLEYHRDEYEQRKARWLAKSKNKGISKGRLNAKSKIFRTISKPDDEAL